MAGGGTTLEETPTWAITIICLGLVLTSILIHNLIHLITKWLIRTRKNGLLQVLWNIKSELMLLGCISLLLTVLQTPISKLCISKKVGQSWHPCSIPMSATKDHCFDTCAKEGKVSLISANAIHQIHIFLFVLAVVHVIQCTITMALGRLKMKNWEKWENEIKTLRYQFSVDPDRSTLAINTSFGRRHLNWWSAQSILVWTFCFFRQFIESITKVDYLTLRHGFVMAHLEVERHRDFEFHKYINRSLEEDFSVIVGISPPLWIFVVFFLLLNTHGWYSHIWLPFIPLIILLLLGTKLQVMITHMGLSILKKGEVVSGAPMVEPGDDLFWFNNPRLILYGIQFVLFQNAFQLAFLLYILLQFGPNSCFIHHKQGIIIIIKATTGVLIQIFCSYVVLPLYALVTQMGSTMRLQPTDGCDHEASTN